MKYLNPISLSEINNTWGTGTTPIPRILKRKLIKKWDLSLIEKLYTDHGCFILKQCIHPWENDFLFYQTIPENEFLPKCYGQSRISENYILVMEDLGKTADLVCSDTGCIGKMLDALADLRNVLEKPPTWMKLFDLNNFYNNMLTLSEEVMPPVSVSLKNDGIKSIKDWIIITLKSCPVGLVHGDFFASNWISTHSVGKIIDWGTVFWGPVAIDYSSCIRKHSKHGYQTIDREDVLNHYHRFMKRADASISRAKIENQLLAGYMLEEFLGIEWLLRRIKIKHTSIGPIKDWIQEKTDNLKKLCNTIEKNKNPFRILIG